MRDKPGNGFHEAACASLHGAAAVYVGIQNEATSAGVGDAADQLEAFRVTPSGPARDRKRRFGWEHNGLSYPGSTVAFTLYINSCSLFDSEKKGMPGSFCNERSTHRHKSFIYRFTRGA